MSKARYPDDPAVERTKRPAKGKTASARPDAGAKPRQADQAKAFTPGALDIEALAHNAARMIEEGGKALAAYIKPREDGRLKDQTAENIADIVRTLGHVLEYWLADPQRTADMQMRLGQSYLHLWAAASKRLAGEEAVPVVTPDPRDKRFNDPEWSSNQFYDFIKQAYLLTTQWADHLVADADNLDPHMRHKAEFYIRQIANALSPSNFLVTNPEIVRETVASNAENLVRGLQNLAKDIAAGSGDLKISQTDMSAFEVGRDLATTPGKVIFQNDLIQLIQYAPTTEKVLATPILIVPPWINKFYVLDLTPDKSFIKWCVDQGLTVFCISWVNPDQRLAKKGFDDYMREGPLAAIDVVTKVTGAEKIHALGYCVGGTLLAVTMAYMAAKQDDRLKSATLLTTQVDFTYAGDLKVFAADEEQVANVEREMASTGYLAGTKMASAFNLMRSNDLIWPYVINNYLKGKPPVPFDMLFWNADATRMPAANHSFYLRACYLDNRLTKGTMAVANQKLDLKKVTVPVYNLATREDHIAPARSVYLGSSFFGGPVRFVLAGAGHMAGVVNHPTKNKYQYWTGGAATGDDIESWVADASEHAGSWWPNWLTWLKEFDPSEAEARVPGSASLPAIEDAPGSYVKVRS